MRQESGALTTDDSEAPLNMRQRAFARELGVAIAHGDHDYVAAYEAAGYAPDRGNASRLAADPRIRAIVDQVCGEQLRLAGLHIGYLQAKALKLLDASPTAIHRRIAKYVEVEIISTGKGVALRYKLREGLTDEEIGDLDGASWPLLEWKLDGITIKLPDKKGIIEMLAKQLGVGKEDSSVNVDVSLEALVNQSIQREAAE